MFSRLTYLFIIALLGSGSAMAADHVASSDGSWISLSGTVKMPTAHSFILDYGMGDVTVEVDDWDNYAEAHALFDGDKVVVLGRVDDDLRETPSIEAGSIYVEDINTYFYASAADEEDIGRFMSVQNPVVVGDVQISGVVSSVDSSDGSFAIDAGVNVVEVATDRLGYNPVDEGGPRQIEVGDRVTVAGDFSRGLIDYRELQAKQVVTLDDNS